MSAENDEKMEIDTFSGKDKTSDKGSDSEDDSSEEVSDNDEELEKQAADLERKVRKYSYRNVYHNLEISNLCTYFQSICCIGLLYCLLLPLSRIFVCV
jgi:hypothetical protein